MEDRQDIEIEIVSKPRDAYSSSDYTRTGLPAAPAITIDGEVIVQGKDISDEKLEEIMRQKTSSGP